MGAEYSSRPTLPEGGVCLAIEHDSAGCGPCGRRQWSDGPRPAWLSMRDGDWAAFSSEVGQLVRSYAPEGWGHVFMLVGFLVGLFVFHPSLGIVRTLDFELSASIGLMMFCMIGGLFAMLAVSIGGRRYNERVDEKIDAVCRAAAARANGGAITFVRLWTAPCKPKGARTFRAVYVYPLVPPGGARSSQGVGRFAAAAGYPTPVATATCSCVPVASAIPSASSVSVASASASASGDVAHGERVSAGLTGESKVVVVDAVPIP
mmetsp:Transcript_2452/g.7288  ORF Transcript_2452/g.7288 Transcript_2452/m.7288 type:complete len:262 (-) Transcript_2452:422-1207(-)